MAQSLPSPHIMAAQLILPRTPARRAHVRVISYREGRGKALLRKAALYCKLGAILITALSAITAIFAYNSYRSFAQVIDQQIAGGYLRGHAGLYAAPRVIEKGARLSKEQLVTSLQRAGYARDRASNIWSGSFQVG